MKTKLNIPRLLIFVISFLDVLSSSPTFASAAQYDGRVKVRDYPFYREFLYKDSHIIINKKSKLSDIVFAKQLASAHILQSKEKIMYSISIPTKNYTNFIVYKKYLNTKGKIGFISKKKSVYFKTPDESFSCSVSYKDGLKTLDASKISEKIYDLQIKKLFDPVTCKNLMDSKSPVLTQLEDTVISGFDPKDSKLVSCLSSKEMQTVLDSNLVLRTAATAVFANYLVLLKKITANESPIKFKCEMPTNAKNKMGCYNETDNSISFNPARATNPQVVSDLFNHEIIHFGSNQISGSAKLNEAIVDEFSCRCANIAAKPDRANLQTDCPKSFQALVGLDRSEAEREGDSIVVVADLTKEDAQQLKTDQAITNNLATTVTPVTFTPVNKTTFDELANAALVATNGSPITDSDRGVVREIVPTPELKQRLDEVYTRLSNSVSGVTQALVKSSVTPAQATTAPTRSIASTNSTTELTPYPRAEIFADKYATNFDTINTIETNTLAKKGTAPGSNDSTISVPNTAKNPDSSASGFASAGGSTSNRTNQTSTTLATVDADEPVAPVAKPTRGIASIDDSATQNTYQPSDNAALQTLVAVNKVSGPKYQEIKKLYSDKNFAKQLQDRNFNIIQPNGKSIGSTSKNATQFVDNGQNLIKVIRKGI